MDDRLFDGTEGRISCETEYPSLYTSRKQKSSMEHSSKQKVVDSSFRGTVWLMLFLLTRPTFTSSLFCPSSCLCSLSGAVKCSGFITDIPQQLPLHTYLLVLNGTTMNVINEQSLANRDLLLRFSLTHSHLHTIHPRAFHAAPQLKSVKLSSNDLSIIPAGAFSPLTTLEQLHLDGNQLETIGPDMFEGLVGLKDLDLSRNKLTDPASDIFDGLTNLTFLNLGRNSIKKLPPTIFHSLTNLHYLMIYNNKLEVLEPGMFDTLVNLVELKIHQNQIASIPPRVFWSLRNLKILTLSSNQLQAVPERSFYNMPMMKKLTIYNNPLLSLPDELMGHMPNITEFYLIYTKLTTVPGNVFTNMSGLVSLKFHLNGNLRDLPPDLFCCLSYLQHLSLRANDLHYLHPQLFSKLTALNVLFLNDNKLKSLPEHIFHGLGGLVSIDLNKNNLKTLPGNIFLSNTALEKLTLSGNPWECTCPIRDIARWIRHNEHVVPDREDVLCHSPPYQMLRTISSLRDEEFSVCDQRTENNSHQPTQPSPVSSTHGQTSLVPSTTAPSTTQGATLKVTLVTLLTTLPPVKSTPSEPTTLSASLPTAIATPLKKDQSMSAPFYDMLVVEQGPEFVHHNLHKGWVYVWFLPPNASLVGFLMFCHILLVATGLSLILAAMYSMHRLSETVDKLKAECARNEG